MSLVTDPAATRIALAADHGGFELKNHLLQLVEKAGHEVIDLGTDGAAAVDYPDYAKKAARGIVDGTWQRAILVCGTGLGMSMAANRVPGIRAACVSDTFSARFAREHNDSNVLCLGARVVGFGLAEDIVKLWLTAQASTEPRHVSRIHKIES